MLPYLSSRARHSSLSSVSSLRAPGAYDTSRPVPNPAYADLLELQELAQDVPLQRNTSHHQNHQVFKQLRIFVKDCTSPFLVAFGEWQHQYEKWQEDSARFFGICRIQTETDF